MLDLAHLPNQRPGERTVLFLRRHWFTVAGIAGALLMLLAIPLVLGLAFWPTVSRWLADPALGPVVVTLAGMYVLSAWLFAFLEFTDYYLDTWIVTTERIRNVEQHGLFNRTASELHLSNVQDVTSEIRGVVRTFFNYGDVHIQTAGEQKRFNFKGIEKPEDVKQTVLRLAQECKRRQGAGQAPPRHPSSDDT